MKDKLTPWNITSLKEYLFSENHPDNDFSDGATGFKMTVEYPLLLFPYELERLALDFNMEWGPVSARLSKQPKWTSETPIRERLEEVKKGRFEMLFAGFLSQHLKLPIHTEVNLQAYSPDIAIHVESIGLWIDIEIDEPYVTDPEPTPVHFKGFDKNRDLFFLEKRWLVIRFHEKQIAELSQCCLKYVYYLLKSIGVYDDPKLEVLLNEVPLDALFWYKKWTKDEAWRMILSKSRSLYRSDINYIKDIPEQRGLRQSFAQTMKEKGLIFDENSYLSLLDTYDLGIREISPPFVKFYIIYKPRRVHVTKVLYDNYLNNIRKLELKRDYSRLSTYAEDLLVIKIEEFAGIIPEIENGLTKEIQIESWNRLSEKVYWKGRSKEIND